jgi:hypothetical protein
MVFHPADFGGKWIRPKKRYQIYKRDGFKCVYCQREFDRFFTLDHVRITSETEGRNVDNDERNLLTCCKTCNSVRSNLSVEKFMVYLVRERGQIPKEVRKRMIMAKHSALPSISEEELKSLAIFLSNKE